MAKVKEDATTTKERIINATLITLRNKGFAGTSARAIAKSGEFNQALIFYHFGGVRNVLLAALDRTSELRLAHYRNVVEQTNTLPELASLMQELYEEDIKEGHITVLGEMVAGSSSDPELGPAVAERMIPWLNLVEEVIEKTLVGFPLANIIPKQDLAFAFVALYLGIDILTNLDGNRSRTDALFASGTQFATLAATFLPTSPPTQNKGEISVIGVRSCTCTFCSSPLSCTCKT